MALTNRRDRFEYNRQQWVLGTRLKACSKCFDIKRYEDYSPHPTAFGGVDSRCKLCKAKHTRETRDKEVSRKQSAEYRKTHPGKVKAQKTAYFEANRKSNINKKQDPNKVKRCKKCREYKPETPFWVARLWTDGLHQTCKACCTSKARSIAQKACGNPIGFCCYLCLIPLTSTDTIHADHVIPQSKQGETTVENIRWVHSTCNLRKSDRLPTNLELYNAGIVLDL